VLEPRSGAGSAFEQLGDVAVGDALEGTPTMPIGENGDLKRMTVEELTIQSEKGNRQLCVISPKLALAVIKPERADERIKPGVQLEGGSHLALVDRENSTHESLAFAPLGDKLLQVIVQCKKRNEDTYSVATGWLQLLNYIYELSQSELTGTMKVKAILDIGPVPDNKGRCYEIVVDWDGNKRRMICDHICDLKRLCKA